MKHGIGRKLLSVVLAVMMLVSLLPTAAFADDSAEPIVVNSVVGDSNTGNDTKLADEALVNVGDTNANEGEGEETTTPVSTPVAKIGNTGYATLDAAITAVQNGETIEVNAGEYTLNGSLNYTGKAFTIAAADGADVSFDMSAAVALHGAKITFNNVTFNYKTNGNYIGLQHTDTLVYNKCTINGMVFLYAVNETFNNCTFNQTSAGAYNVWTYGAQNVAFNGCTFNCVGRCVLVYNEGAIDKTDLTVENTKFNASAPAEGKAAIEIDTHLMKGGATITVDETTTDEGFAAGSNSGSTLWNDKKQTVGTNKNTTVTVAGETVFTPVATAAVAKIGKTEYDTLDEALEYLVGLEQKDMQPTPEEYALTLLDESAWNTATPVYWAAGEQHGYVAKLTDALTAAYKANAGKITIVCRPGADVGTMTHGHVADDITIFGNKAYVSGGECDLEVDTYKYSRTTGAQDTTNGSYLDGDIGIIAFQLDNLGVWGERHTTHTVNVALVDCDSVKNIDVQRVYISGTSGKNMIGVTDCDFKTANTAVYSNADGVVAVSNCTFTGSKVSVNINHKANGTMSVDVQDCTFTNCGDTGEWKQFAAPVRFVNSGSGTMVTGVQKTTFTGTVGTNGDILLGDGRTGQKSNDVSMYVSGTDANIQAQKPGYYNGNTTDANKKAATEVKSNETLDTSVETLLPAENVIDLNTFIERVKAANYNYDGNGITVKWSPVSGCYDTREGHKCTVNNVTATGNTPKRVNSGLTQFQLFEGQSDNVTVKNVKFVYEPADFTVCENSGWKGSFTAEQAPAGQLYFMTTGDVNFEGCTFDKVVLTSFNTTGTTTVKNCQFANVYNNYAIKDIRGANISVTGTTITNCGGGIMVSSTDKVEKVTIWKNTFTNVDVAGTAVADKVGTRALIQIASSGDYSGTSFNLTANTATDCGPVLRQLNQTVVDSGKIDEVKSDVASLVKGGTTGLGTTDSLLEQPVPAGYVEDASGNVTISDEAGLFWFAKQVNEKGNTFADKIVTLANDITLTKAWKPIGDFASNTAFKGTFDGQNHTVSGMQVRKYSTSGVGFFAKTFTATVKNLTVEGKITAYGCNYVGGIVGHGYATITNCTFRGTITNNGGYQVGGIAGSGGFTIKDCAVYGDISAESWVGGIAGNVQDGGAFTNCYVEGTISANSSAYGASAAGIAAIPLYKTQKISGCYSNTVVKCGDEEINAPIIGAYNSAGVTADTELYIYDNSWNKAKNPNDSYEVKDGATVIEGKDVSRDNNLVMLEDDLQYVTDLSKVRIMAGSAVTQAQVDALAVASIGTAKYISLAAAIAAANNGDTVTLLKNVTENVEIAKEKNLTLDLNGCILNGGTGTAKAALTNYGTITITDSSTTKAGTIKRDDMGIEGETSYYVIRNRGTMTIESGNVNNNSGYEKANSTGSMVGSSLICNGDCDEGGTLTIKGGTFTQNNFIAIKNGALGVLHVTGGTITSNHSAIQNWFEADITGGEIKGQLWTDAYIEGESVGKTTIGGNAKFTGEIVMDITGNVVPTLAITGGKLDVTNWRITTAAANAGAKPAVSGGTFKAAVPAEYCAEGFIPKDNGDGTFGVKAGAYVAQIGDVKYETLQAAINAAKAGDTVTLLVNTTEDVTINKDITLDLGGKTLTNTSAGKATISVTGGKVTVKGGSVKGGTSYYNIEVTKGSNANLTLENVTATAGNTGSSMIDNWGTLTIESGTYEGGLNVVKSEEGSTLTINGGKFTGNYAPSSGYTAVILVYGNTTITGGEFIQSLTTTGSWAHPQVVMTGVVEGYEAFTTVTGGTFTNKKSENNNIFRGLGKATSDNFEVSGGTFNKSVSDSYFKTGYFAKKTADGYTADGPYAVRLGTAAGYATLEEAFAAAKSGDTITLLTDCQSDRINLEDKSVKVNLNGKTLTSTAAYGVMFCAKNGNKITITGTTPGSKLVGTLMVTAETDGRIEIDGGTYESAQYCPIYINGAVSSENSKLTVKNATITALPGDSNQDSGVAVYLAGYSTSTFKNTTITAPVTGLEIRAGKLTLTNCTVTGGSGEVVTNANGNGTTVTNAAVAISQHTTKKNIDVTITGGTYTATAAVYQTNVQGTGSEGVKASIKSGKFDGTVSAETDNTVAVSGGTFSSAVPENCCADGFIPTKNADDTYGVKQGTYVAETNGVKYESLQAAIDAAGRKATVKLLADTRENVTISTPYLTLDLNGFTLNGSTGERKPALTITARVTVKDSSEGQTGTIMREDTADNSGVSSHYVIDIQGAGWLTFEGGTVTNNSGNAAGKGASLVRVGDDSVEKYPGLNIKGGTFTQDNFIVIKVDSGDLFLNGGTLNSANSYAIEDWHRATIKGGTVNGTVAAWTYSGGHNSDLTISGGTVNGNVASVSYDKTEGKLAKVSITGGTVTGTLGTYTYNNGLDPIENTSMATIEVTGGTFDKDPTKYVVEGSTVTKNSEGKFGVEKAYLAKVGNTSYYTMDEAFKAQTASGEPIVLLRDYTTGSTFNSGTVARVVDLGGHTWTCTGTDANSAAFEINNPNASLTVKNGKIVSSQLVGLIPSAMGGTIKYDNSSLVFESVKMTTTANSGIETNGNNTNDTVKLVNSELNVPNGFGIYFPSSGTLTIDNSQITAKTMGVQVCAGSLNITGDKTAITVTGDGVTKTENDGAIQDGAAISIVNRIGYKGLGDVTVTGGKFTAKTGNDAIKAYDWANNTEDTFTANDSVSVSGGTFSSAVPAGLCAPGYVPTEKDENGYYTVAVKDDIVAVIGDKEYTTLSEALKDAAKNGGTVLLVADVDDEELVHVRAGVTLNLNGHSITKAALIIVTGRILDTADANARGIISAEDYTITPLNGYTPVYDKAKGGYSFFNLWVRSAWESENNKGIFALGRNRSDQDAIECAAAKKLLGADLSRVDAVITFSWEDQGTIVTQEFTFQNEKMLGYLGLPNGVLTVVVSGLDQLSGSVKMQAKFVFYKESGAELFTLYGDLVPVK